MKPTLLALAVLLAGCGPQMHPAWVLDGETPESRRKTFAECRFESIRAAAGVSHPNPFLAASDRGAAEDRVFAACLRARGYRQERRLMTFQEFMASREEGL